MGPCKSCFANETTKETIIVELNSVSGMLERQQMECNRSTTLIQVMNRLQERKSLTRPSSQLVVVCQDNKVQEKRLRIENLSAYTDQLMRLLLFIQPVEMEQAISRGQSLVRPPSIKIPTNILRSDRSNSNSKKNVHVVLNSKSGVVNRRIQKIFQGNTTVAELLVEIQGLLNVPAHTFYVRILNQDDNSSIVEIVDRQATLASLLSWSNDTVFLWLEKLPPAPAEEAHPQMTRTDSVSSLRSNPNDVLVKFQSRNGITERTIELSVRRDKTVKDLLDHLIREGLVKVARHAIVVKNSKTLPVDLESNIGELSPSLKPLTLFLEYR